MSTTPEPFLEAMEEICNKAYEKYFQAERGSNVCGCLQCDHRPGNASDAVDWFSFLGKWHH